MSGSLAPNDHVFRKSSGKTPPPAPSAGFAKRLADAQAARYRPPALRSGNNNSPPNGLNDPADQAPSVPNILGSVESGPLPPTNYGPNFKRARAGTLPSNVQLAAQRYASTLGTSSHSSAADMVISQPAPTLNSIMSSGNLTPGGLTAPSQTTSRPSLRHASTAAPTLSGERSANSRLRSGSLTLPPSGPIAAPSNNNAFGSSVFSSSWLNPQSGYPALDEHRSLNSSDSLGDDVHTLDYLGLDDRARAPQPATVTELRSQAQAAIAGRLRAMTVSNPYRNRPLQPLTTQGANDLDDLVEYDSPGGYGGRVDSLNGGMGGGMYYNSEQSSMIARGFKQSQHLGVNVRARATSVGALEDPSRLRQSPVYGDMSQGLPLSQSSISAANSILRGLADGKGQASASRLTQPGRYTAGDVSPVGNRLTVGTSPGFLQPPQGQPRSLSPKGESPQIQTPSRSLWIGNLDTTATKETLLTVFSPYGAIESLRLLPEKECGFVNFLDINDAIRAKEDVLNRLVRARKALNGRDVLGSDVGAIRIGYARVPVKTGAGDSTGNGDDAPVVGVQGIGDLTVGATIHALRSVKGATTIPADQQVLGGAVENYRSNLLLSMIGSGNHNISDGQARPPGWTPSVTEQQMIMKELAHGVIDAEGDIQALAGETS
ncbi:hypothetical protein FRB91_010068 [Serendipita sp. 411]|nr:hypothetical protein FRB91_010068 [Serendipita sp. 411]